MSREQSIIGDVAGATFSLRTDAADLAAYAATHLAPLARRTAAAPAVAATLRWHDGQPPLEHRLAPAAWERVDRDVYTDGTTLHWFRVDDLRDLFMRFTWADGRLAVGGDFYYRLGNSRLSDGIRRVRRWSQRAALRQRRFTTLLYYLVYYPCWWWLEQTRDLHPIHAAGVRTDAGVILLAGASGVGKSSLAVALAMSPGARLLADSFVLHNGRELSAVHEPVLLDAWSRRWLAECSGELQAIAGHFGLGRRGYHVPPSRLADAGQAALLVFPRRTPQPYVRRIAPEQAQQRLSAANLMINDLRRYWAFGAVLEQVQLGGLAARREAHLGKLVAEVPCYEFGLAADMTSAAAVRAIAQLTPEKPLRVAGLRQ